jgi:CBS domain-containing protein
MTITISDVMKKGVDTIEEAASIQETAIKMRDKNVSSLVVLDRDHKPTGLVTERDLVRKVCVNNVHTGEVTNKEIMSFPLVTIDSMLSPSIAADTMLRRNVRHLIVIDEKSTDANKLVGMITPRDFTKYMEYTREEIRSIQKILEYYI